MSEERSDRGARDRAVACARRIFYRPQSIVDALVASFCGETAQQTADPFAVARACYQRPIRMGATLEVFALRAGHWPMLNLLDAAERDRRAFADAMVHAVTAARTGL